MTCCCIQLHKSAGDRAGKRGVTSGWGWQEWKGQIYVMENNLGGRWWGEAEKFKEPSEKTFALWFPYCVKGLFA